MFLGKLDGSGIGGTDAHSAPTSDASGIDERSARLETPAAPSTVASACAAASSPLMIASTPVEAPSVLMARALRGVFGAPRPILGRPISARLFPLEMRVMLDHLGDAEVKEPSAATAAPPSRADASSVIGSTSTREATGASLTMASLMEARRASALSRMGGCIESRTSSLPVTSLGLTVVQPCRLYASASHSSSTLSWMPALAM
mmetsp:Transcript_75347/g.226371  ORF Transcript_75347/g.226371 Transcript_75347/m.226371 type:complete len:204 (-) Transcript_75347:841-1452(-)